MDPPLSLLNADEALTKVAEALEAGDRDCARQALRQIDRVAAHHYYLECGIEGPRRQKENPVDRPERVLRRSISDATRRRIGSRDGWRCRYCGLPVADRVFFRKLRSALPEEFPPPAPIEGTAWTIERVFSAKPDHIVPVAAGGATTDDNLLTACGACNDQAKGDALLSPTRYCRAGCERAGNQPLVWPGRATELSRLARADTLSASRAADLSPTAG